MKWSNRVFANILGIFLLIGFFSFQFGRSTLQPFVRETEIKSRNYAMDLIGSPTGGVYTGGASFQRSNVLNWDSNGVLNWEKSIEIVPYWEGDSNSYSSKIRDMQIDAEGNLYTLTFISNPTVNNFDECYLIQKLDENCNEIWKTEIIGNFTDNFEPFILLDNEGNLYVTINENRDGLNVMKLDSGGNILWKNYYGGNEIYTSHSSAAINENNSLFIIGINNEGFGIFIKMDSLGNLIFNTTFEEHRFKGINIGENGSLYTIGNVNNDETDLSIEFIKWNSDGILLEEIYWNITSTDYNVYFSYLNDMHFFENDKIYALVSIHYSSSSSNDQSEQNFVEWDLQMQSIQNKSIVTVNESDEIWISSFLIDSDNNLYTAGITNQSVLLSKWDHSFNKIWDKTWRAESRIQLSYPFLENGGGFTFVILAGIIAFYFVSTNLILKILSRSIKI